MRKRKENETDKMCKKGDNRRESVKKRPKLERIYEG